MKKAIKELLLGMCMVSISITLIGCNANNPKSDLPNETLHSTEINTEQSQTDNNKTPSSSTKSDIPNTSEDIPATSLIDASGMTLESRIRTPEYTFDEGSLKTLDYLK